MTTDSAAVNPFDRQDEEFLVLKNRAGQYSLWPLFAACPQGWDTVFGPAPRPQCCDFIEAEWQTINPFAAVAGSVTGG
ncbi:MAG: MbtH family protein [Pseudomonadota bacterium]|nr:MbtH family protein [Pseudomonadota bacterium]